MFELDSDNDGCNEIIQFDFENLENFQGDPDSDGVYGNGVQTFDNGAIDERGRVIVRKNENGYGTDPKNNDGNYLFQKLDLFKF